MLPELTNDELSTIAGFYNQTEDGSPVGHAVSLDPTNEQHTKLIEIVLRASGQTKEKYPHLYNEIERGGAPDTNKPNNMIIVDAGADENGKATALIWQANNDGTLYSGGSLLVLDGEKDELLAFGSSTDVHSGLFVNNTNILTAKPANKSIRVLGVNHMVGHDGVARFTSVAGSRTVYESAPTCTIDEPIIDKTAHPDRKYILIAVGRDAAHKNADADYYYTETNNQNDPYLIVPFKGGVTLPHPIVAGTKKSNIGTLSFLSVDYGSATNAELDSFSSYTTASVLADGITVTIPASGNGSISWNYPSDHNGASTTTSLVYNSGPANDKLSYYFFQFTIPVTGTLTGHYVYSIYSQYSGAGKPPFNPSSAAKSISPIQFWWHCIAKETQVTMSDDSFLNIEDLNNSHRVRSGTHGGDLGVEATALGHHEAKTNQIGLQGVYRLRTEGGNELVATGAHPVMTPNGAMMICHLNVGDTVLVTDGISSVVSCDPIEHSGMFYDLKLGNAEDRSRMGQNPVNSYYANGILVGDRIALNNQADRQRYDLDFILPRIGADFRIDYTSAVKDRLY